MAHLRLVSSNPNPNSEPHVQSIASKTVEDLRLALFHLLHVPDPAHYVGLRKREREALATQLENVARLLRDTPPRGRHRKTQAGVEPRL